jgi:hypothetical protein
MKVIGPVPPQLAQERRIGSRLFKLAVLDGV